MKKKNEKSIILWVIALIVLVVLVGLIIFGYVKNATMEVKNPIVTMEIQDYGTVKMELYPEIAPESVANFVNLVNQGYYNGLTFHRIVKDFMIQGGDKLGDGTGTVTHGDIKGTEDETVYSIKGEFIANGFDNNLKFEEGILGMARSDYTQSSSELTEESYNSGGSQFFITTEKSNSLNGYYTAFGKVTEGMDIINKIEEVEVTYPASAVTVAEDGTETIDETAEVSTPVTDIVITSITVDTFGINYELPNLLEAFDYMTWLYAQYGLDPNSISY